MGDIMKLAGKTVLVVGGGTGVGQGIALALANEGCRVAVAGRREDKLKEVASRHRGSTPVLTHPCDVADRKSVEKLFDWADKQLGPLDIVVNSAGMNVRKRTFADMLPEEWDQVLGVNATGAFNCLWFALQRMRKRGEGLNINIVSIAGKRGSKMAGVAYSASKFCMAALGTIAWADEAKNGVRVTNIHPGEVDTEILSQRPTPPTPEARAKMLQPEDLAAAVVMIASLPPRAHVPELIMKPLVQDYV
jgi:NAD(P)-dependent dehydrogenase (short-subunit alcohol dehydrogenase family)